MRQGKSCAGFRGECCLSSLANFVNHDAHGRRPIIAMQQIMMNGTPPGSSIIEIIHGYRRDSLLMTHISAHHLPTPHIP